MPTDLTQSLPEETRTQGNSEAGCFVIVLTQGQQCRRGMVNQGSEVRAVGWGKLNAACVSTFFSRFLCLGDQGALKEDTSHVRIL